MRKVMAGIQHRQIPSELNRYMRIAMDKGVERNVRVAAEALASAILNGAPERQVCSEAMEILLEDEEMQAIEALNQVFAGKQRKN
jgi:uncharacterized protein (UPF0147 family)